MNDQNETNTDVQTSADPYKQPAVLEQMKTMYTAATTDAERVQAVEMLVKQLGKSKASVIGKLGALKVYKAKARTTKSGGPIVRKWQIVDEILEVSAIDMTDAESESLGKATKNTLDKLLVRFKELKAQIVPPASG